MISYQFLRALPMKWRAKMTAIKKAKDLATLPIDELIGNLKVYEMILASDGVASAPIKKREKVLEALEENVIVMVAWMLLAKRQIEIIVMGPIIGADDSQSEDKNMHVTVSFNRYEYCKNHKKTVKNRQTRDSGNG
ncbi:hypothetical protein Tco_0771818 [Tanacetum coccineum]|uniref:UBN2 domain-containing protein n=1 Tax=Tanacetum coccineum TaxID=301880 RepID=A0ABQ4ZJ25_9ASTR